MKLLYFISLFSFIFLEATNYAPPPAVHVAPSSLTAGDQYFDASPKGFREYLESIKDENLKVYNKLDKDVSKLESKSTTATVTTALGVIIGLGCMLIPLATMKPGEPVNMGVVIGSVGVGTGLLFGGIIAGSVIRPGRDDMMKVINKHNKINPDNPIKLQLGSNYNNNSRGLIFSIDKTNKGFLLGYNIPF